MSNEWKPLSRFGMLDFIEQNCCDQHWIDMLVAAFTMNDMFKLLKFGECLGSQRLYLINTLGKKLGNGCLWAVHTKPPLKLLQFFWAEICGIACTDPS